MGGWGGEGRVRRGRRRGVGRTCVREEPSGRVRGGLGLGLLGLFFCAWVCFSVRFKITDRIIAFFLCVHFIFSVRF